MKRSAPPPRARAPRAPREAPLEPTRAPRGRKHLTTEEWDRVRRAAAGDLRTHALILLLYECGLRREEPGQMRLSYLEKLHEGRIFVWRQKGSLSGWMDLSRPTAEAVARWVDHAYPLPAKRRRDSFVFTGGRRRGAAPLRGITGRSVYNLYQGVAQQAELEAHLQHPHVLKASRVQHLLEHMTKQGLDPGLALQSIAAIVGHATAQTTIRYYVAATEMERVRVNDFTKKMTGGG